MKLKIIIIISILLIISGSLSYISARDTVLQEEKDYLILVHGLGRSKLSMLTPALYFRNIGYEVININYPSTKYKIQTLADEYLEKAVKMCSDKDKKIHFFTHSLGGLIVRYYLDNHQLDNLGRVVMLSPPNQGTELADIIYEFPTFRWRNGPAIMQLTTDNNSLPNRIKPVNYEVGIIAGKKSYSIFASLLIPGKDDGKVSVENAKIENMKDFITVNRTHTFIMNDDLVLKQAHNFFQKGRFADDNIIRITDFNQVQKEFSSESP